MVEIGKRVKTGVWNLGEFVVMGKGTVVGYDGGIYKIQRDYCWNGKPCIENEQYNYVVEDSN